MLNMMKMAYRTPNRQRGVAAVEFAITAMLLFTLLFGILEFGRLFYLYNTVQEVTRHAAREAVVNFTSHEADIQREAIFQPGTTGVVGLLGGGEVTNLKVSIRYLHGTWNTVDEEWEYSTASPSSSADNISQCLSDTSNCINFVEVKVCMKAGNSCVPVEYEPMTGLFSFLFSSVPIPASTVIMPAESMGYPLN